MVVKIIDKKEDWYQFIAERILHNIKTKNTNIDKQDNERAVLVFFQSEAALKEFEESAQYKNELKDINLFYLVGKQTNQERDDNVKSSTN